MSAYVSRLGMRVLAARCSLLGFNTHVHVVEHLRLQHRVQARWGQVGARRPQLRERVARQDGRQVVVRDCLSQSRHVQLDQLRELGEGTEPFRRQRRTPCDADIFQTRATAEDVGQGGVRKRVDVRHMQLLERRRPPDEAHEGIHRSRPVLVVTAEIAP